MRALQKSLNYLERSPCHNKRNLILTWHKQALVHHMLVINQLISQRLELVWCWMDLHFCIPLSLLQSAVSPDKSRLKLISKPMILSLASRRLKTLVKRARHKIIRLLRLTNLLNWALLHLLKSFKTHTRACMPRLDLRKILILYRQFSMTNINWGDLHWVITTSTRSHSRSSWPYLVSMITRGHSRHITERRFFMLSKPS